jgi:hypothetical protein
VIGCCYEWMKSYWICVRSRTNSVGCEWRAGRLFWPDLEVVIRACIKQKLLEMLSP